MEIGDIYWVKFEPSFGHEYKKTRPAVVIQSDGDIEFSPYVTVVPITGKVEKWRSPDIFIPKDAKNKLFKDSIIRVQHISSFDRERLLGKIGSVNSPVLRQIRGYLRRHFKL